MTKLDRTTYKYIESEIRQEYWHYVGTFTLLKGDRIKATT